MMSDTISSVSYPFPDAPAFAEPREVAPGILWLRVPLPYLLDHVNVYLFEEPGGWAVFDTGINSQPSIEAWERVLANTLGGRPITRLVISHFHPDHVGMAGWLSERFAGPLHMPQAEYLYSRMLQAAPPAAREEDPPFYRALGLTADETREILIQGKGYLQRTTGLSRSYERLKAGDSLMMGGREWQILTGGGHAPEQAMLWCRQDRLFLSADQILARISPNVSVVEIEPHADPLKLYRASLDQVRVMVDDDVLVLPGHNLPFRGLHERIDQLARHHEHRCGLIAAACEQQALTCAELLPSIFRRSLDLHQMSFALGEALAHLNYMTGRAELTVEAAGGVVRYRSTTR